MCKSIKEIAPSLQFLHFNIPEDPEISDEDIINKK